MRKVDSFFVLILVLFFGLATAYISFDYHLSGVSFEKSKNETLQRQLSQLNLVVESLQAQASPNRGIASVGPTKMITLDGLYKEQLTAARVSKDSKKVTALSEKIIGSSLDPDLLAQAYFLKAELSCATYLIKENTCLSEIETLISQFPESVWAGEGLLVLSAIYSKQKRYKEANSLLKIVKAEFQNQKSLLVKASQLEKTML